jgi:two-component system, LytTR family, sensor kinase
MKIIRIIIKSHFLKHLIFWVVVWLIYVYFFSYNSSDREYIYWFSSALLPIAMLTTYLTVYWLIPKFLLNRRIFQFLLYSFYLLVFSSYAIVLVIYTTLFLILKFEVSGMPPMTKNYFSVLLLIYLVVVVASMFSILIHNYRIISMNKELENIMLETQLQLKEQELGYLKMQIHPHFLFNTLNTIYGFALKQSQQTPEMILKLSNLLDYILYQVNKPKVKLIDEVKHIKEYIDLERIRFHDSLIVSFKSNIDDEKFLIAPMLLIPFVENAFKHGSIINGFLRIDICIELTGTKLKFFIGNSVFNETDVSTNGIGLENISKRLGLHYPGSHILKIEKQESWFSVLLEIQLSNHKLP